MNSIGPISPIAQDLLELVRNPQPRVREIAARLAGRLDAAPAVREMARAALERMRPDGGRGNKIIARHGGYGGLKALQAAEIVNVATTAFCNRFIDRRSRTHDQMVQAARSSKQNIVEGSAAAGISSKTELRLIGVARASLEELLADYRDFLRQRNLPQWEKSDRRAQEIQQLAYAPNRSYQTYRLYFEHSPPKSLPTPPSAWCARQPICSTACSSNSKRHSSKKAAFPSACSRPASATAESAKRNKSYEFNSSD